MEAVQRITVGISSELLARAQRASGARITETVRTGLQLVAASEAYARLRELRGKGSTLAPAVLTELLSDPKLPRDVRATLDDIPLPEVTDGFWQRASELRAVVLGKRRKARHGDALIAQCCLDGGVPLITRDRDFRSFADAGGLDLVAGLAG